MALFKKTIFTGFSPNTSSRDVRAALSFLFFPWKWPYIKHGRQVGLVAERLRHFFGVSHAVPVDSGRSALLLALKSFGIQKGDEVLVQAYTCVVVINAIQFSGGTPVYVDIANNFCMDPDDVRKKITSRTKAMIIQHTFGHAAPLDALLSIAREHGINTVEDCAHVFGATYRGKKLGTFADIAMLSFGSDKAISSIRGGAVITNDAALATYVSQELERLPSMPLSLIIKHLFHYPVFYIGRAWYRIGLGKALLSITKRSGLINLIIEPAEKKGQQPDWFPATYPNALAALLLVQMNDIDRINMHRSVLSRYYAEKLSGITGMAHPPQDEESVLLRYTIQVQNPSSIHFCMKQKGILLGDWYDSVIAPKDIDAAATGYIPGSCPRAEQCAASSVNLPTGRLVEIRDAEVIIDSLKTCLPTLLNK